MDVTTLEEISETYQKTGRYSRADGTPVTHQEYFNVLALQANNTHIFNTNTGSQYRFVKQCVGTTYAIMTSNEGTKHISLSQGLLVTPLRYQNLNMMLSDLLPYGVYSIVVGEQKVSDLRDWTRRNKAKFNTTDELVYKDKIKKHFPSTSDSSISTSSSSSSSSSSEDVQPDKKYSSSSSSSSDGRITANELFDAVLLGRGDLGLTLSKFRGSIPCGIFEEPFSEDVYILLNNRERISDECNRIHYLSLCIRHRNLEAIKRLLGNGMIPTDIQMRLAYITRDSKCINLVSSKYKGSHKKVRTYDILYKPDRSIWLSDAIRCNMGDDVRSIIENGVTPTRDHIRLALLTNNPGAVRCLIVRAPDLVIDEDLIKLTQGNRELHDALLKK